MLIRLTTPEAFDRLIDCLEKERNLTWPTTKFSDGTTYRDNFIANVKEKMKSVTQVMNIDWKYDSQRNCVYPDLFVCSLDEMLTDEDYLKELQYDPND